MAGDLTVDTSTLKVDSTNNRVGVGTASPNANTKLDVNGAARIGNNTDGIMIENNTGTFDIDNASYIRRNSSSGALEITSGSTTARNMIFNTRTNGAVSMTIDSTGAITKPLQPAFNVNPTSAQDNVAEDETIVFGTERFDNNADFASNTFTAPVTGKYQFTISLRVDNIDTAADWNRVELVTSNYTYLSSIIDLGGLSADPVHWHFNFSVLADLDAGDTALVKWGQDAGATQVDISTQSSFSGYLVA